MRNPRNERVSSDIAGDGPERKCILSGQSAARDALIRLARLVDGPSRAVRQRYEEKVEEPQKQAYGKISNAIFALRTLIAPVKPAGKGNLSLEGLEELVGNMERQLDIEIVDRLTLTASGGPFRGWSSERLDAVTPAQALRHPTWAMGAKITVDSATLMNKGLEVIECYHLFGVPLEKIQVVVHPQSIVHSMVEFLDGSIIAQLAWTDMRVPIQYALSYPERLPGETNYLDFAQLAQLTFEDPDHKRFPCLELAYESVRLGGNGPRRSLRRQRGRRGGVSQRENPLRGHSPRH